MIFQCISLFLQRLGWDKFVYTCLEGDCQVLVHIFLKVENITAIPSVTLSVSTSAEDNVVDMAVKNSATDLGTPFAIYAKVYHIHIQLKNIVCEIILN